MLNCQSVDRNEVKTILNKHILETEKYTSVGFKSLTFYGGFDRYLTGFEENAEFIRIRKVYPKSFWRTHRPPTIKYPEGSNIVYKDKIFCTNQVATSLEYTINKDEYTEHATNNEFIILD